ncbi:MAG: DegT/DnrJ/EryC1/StrS family aminotransferase [Candidatus Scalinduaceae bacterium]
MKIPITKPVFDEEDKRAISRPLETGWIVQGPNVKEFEELFAKSVNVKHAVATSSCTTALHLGLLALGVSPGDEVIVPSFTFIATVNAVEYCQAKPVFCDIELRTFNMDVNMLEEICKRKAQNKKLKAIVPVSLFGLCADMPAICEIADKYGLKVLEDSACAFGAYVPFNGLSKNRLCHSGTFGYGGCFSFHPRKSITTGEGGIFISNDEQLSKLVRKLRDHGASKSDLERHINKGGTLLPDYNILGYNYRMTDIQGALGVSQMKKAGDIINKRRKIAERYDEALKEVEHLIPPYVPEGYTHGYQSYVCLFTDGDDVSNLDMEKINNLNVLRNKFMDRLERKGIATRQGTHAVHTLGYYKGKYNLNDVDYVNSYAADRLSITLPLYSQMTDEEFEYVTEQIKAQS